MKYSTIFSHCAMALICAFTFMQTTHAQDEQPSKEQQEFTFVYIAQDASTELQTLSPRLRNSYNLALADGTPTIFYLANNDHPFIIKMNFDGGNNEDFDKVLMKELQENKSHTVNGFYDHAEILRLFEQHSFVNDAGSLSYRHVNLDFYVGSSFWTMKNNEYVIAALFFELNIARYLNDEGRMSFHVFCPRAATNIDPDIPFGIMNPDGINDKISLTRY